MTLHDRLLCLHGWVSLQWGWRRWALAFLAGAASALAMPPFSAFPVLALTLPVLVWLLDGAGAAGGPWRTLMASAVSGWWFGFGYFLAGLWWIGTAFLVTPEQHAWLLPIAVLSLPMGLALFPALGATAARLVWSPGAARVIALAAGLGGSEWLRGHVLTGFPWNSLGYALADNAMLGQAASLIGMEGLTFVAAAVFAAPAALRLRPAVLAVLTLAVLAGFGGWRLMAPPSFTDGITVRIMQPAVQQDDKFRPEIGPQLLERYLTLSDISTTPGRSGIEGVSLLVWPETAFPFLLSDTPEALARIADFLPEGTTLATGAFRAEGTAPDRVFYNSIHMIDGGSVIRASYDKVHLVPFGEYLPFRGILESAGVSQLIALAGGFTAGERRVGLTLPEGVTFAPLICYEAIFPHGVLPEHEPRPQALLNVTNDAWFGDTPGPHQHLAQARVRSIEQGLPLIRAANSGISAVIDPYGRTVAALGLGTASAIDAPLPAALPPTIYARIGAWIPGCLFIIFYLFAMWQRRRI